MKAKIILQAKNKSLCFDLNYQHALQSFVYNNLNIDLSQKIHSQNDKRNYKYFTFSKLYSDEGYKIKDKKISFLGNTVYFYFSSVNAELFQNFLNNLLLEDYLYLQDNELLCRSVEIINEQIPQNCSKVIIKTLSPVIVRSTLYDVNGKRKSYFYNPCEQEWSKKIYENLARKYQKWFGVSLHNNKFQIKALKRTKQVLTRYKDTILIGYEGKFLLESDLSKETIKFMLDIGIGEKNSMGFGFITIAEYLN
ncbi:MAG: CRISPR-associated endoribonuclease Cas6 [Candidatus Micrarchaeia archaeon]